MVEAMMSDSDDDEFSRTEEHDFNGEESENDNRNQITISPSKKVIFKLS